MDVIITCLFQSLDSMVGRKTSPIMLSCHSLLRTTDRHSVEYLVIVLPIAALVHIMLVGVSVCAVDNQ